jgi:Insect cuticle protein
MQEQKVRDREEDTYMRLLQELMVVFVLSFGLQAAQSPFSGTWKLNPTKSTISAPSPRGEIVQVTADENSIEVASDVLDPVSSKTTKSSYKAAFDGKDYPVTGDPREDSIAFQRIAANTLKATAKKGGKVVGEYTFVVSADGRTTTVNYTETDSEGNTYKGSEVYEKQ